MPKAKYNKLDFLPKSYNFGELEPNEDGQILDGDAFEDKQDNTYSNIFADEIVVQILFNLKDREKVVFMYQLLRESGYEIDYGSAAQTMGIQRQSYMKMLSLVKKKARVIITDAYKERS
ncbi:MAG: hypothetical protein IFNCLDLE_02674 [Ignavibacteriaceae bacterium]|nr:hypothetical protein [Ignavibacteriaceae bacterium]